MPASHRSRLSADVRSALVQAVTALDTAAADCGEHAVQLQSLVADDKADLVQLRRAMRRLGVLARDIDDARERLSIAMQRTPVRAPVPRRPQ